MRNLKRALSLALASVMLMGMMVVGTSAKGLDDFSDSAEVVNQDAVAVTSEIGIFDGYDDGEFKPENVVTRAEMAVIICKMLYGADVSVSQFAETSVFTDVPAWAEGYVNLCASLGIVAGVGDNKFAPNKTVTTAEAAMMLTKALGYFQSARDFGDSWVLSATAKATELGLYGDLKLTAAAGLTRDNVAEMVFNTLTKAVPVQYNELLGVYYNENKGIIYSLEFNYLQTLGYKNFDLVYKSNTETMYGRPATTWGFGTYNVNTGAGDSSKTDVLTENGGLIASKVRMLDKDEIITIANTPTYVYTEGTDEKNVLKDLGKTVCNDDIYVWTAYVNGKEQDEAKIPTSVSDRYTYTNEGTVTEIYIDDADETVVVVEINNYLGQVSKVKADGDGEYVIVKELSDGQKLDANTFYTEEFAEDDYVIFTVDYDEDAKDYVIGELFAPEVVTGEVSRVENNKDTGNTYLRVEGTKYPYSEYEDAQQNHMVFDLTEQNTKAHPELNVNYNLYMDPNGYVVAFVKADSVETNYLYVLDADEEMGDWRIKVLLPDGTVKNVDVKADLASTSDEFNAKTIKWADEDQDKKTKTNIEGLIWAYSVNSSDVYSLTYVDQMDVDYFAPTKNEAQTKTDEKAAEIHNGKAYITVGDDDIIVDKQTIFVDKPNGKAYVGYKEVPNVEDATLAYVMNKNVADVVFILDGVIYDANSTYFMLSSAKRESLKYDGDHYWEYFDAYVAGEKTPVIVSYKANDSEALEKGVLYQAKKSLEDGKYITEIDVIDEADVIDGEVYAVGDDAFWVTDTKDDEYKFDADEETVYVYVEIDKDGDLHISEGNIDDMKEQDDFNTEVWVVTADGQTARLVYIFATDISIDDDKDFGDIEYTVDIDYSTGDATVTYTDAFEDDANAYDALEAVKAELKKNGYENIDVIRAGNTFKITAEKRGVKEAFEFNVADNFEAISIQTITVVDANGDGVTAVTTPTEGQVLNANVELSDGTKIYSYPVNADVTYEWVKGADATSDNVVGTEGSITVDAGWATGTAKLFVTVSVEGYVSKTVEVGTIVTA